MAGLYDRLGVEVNRTQKASTGKLYNRLGIETEPQAEQSQPPGVTADEMRQSAISGLLGISKGDIDFTSGAPASVRGQIGLLGNTDEEKIAAFKKINPNGWLARVNVPEMKESHLVFKVNKDDPNEKLKTVEDYAQSAFDITSGDIADLAQDAPAAVGASLPFLIPGVREAGLASQMMAGAGGAALGRIAQEGAQQVAGTARQKPVDVLWDAGKEAALYGTGFAAGAGLNKLIGLGTGAGVMSMKPETRAFIQELHSTSPEIAKRVDPTLIDPERHKVISRLGSQADAATGVIAGRREQIENLVTQDVAKMGDIATADIGGSQAQVVIGDELKRLTKKAIATGNMMIKSNFSGVSLEEAGKMSQTALARDYVRESAAVKNSLWNEVDAAAARENPVFDMSPALKAVQTIRKNVADRNANGALNGADLPAELANVMSDIERLATTQTDYRGIKDLRTRLFDLTDNEPWQWDINKKMALDLYRGLTASIKSAKPTNRDALAAPGTKTFIQAWNDATQFTSQRYDVLESQRVRAIVNQENYRDITKRLLKPGELTENIHKAFQSSPEKWDTVRNTMQLELIESNRGRAVASIERYKREAPESFARFVKPEEEKELLNLATISDQLNSSQAASLLEKQTIAGQFVSQLVKNQDAAELKNLISLYGGHGSRGAQLFKAGLLEHMLYESTEFTGGSSVGTISSTKFARLLKDYNRNGALDTILTKEEKNQLLLLNKVVKFVRPSFDTGTSLENAQIITNLKHPSTFLKGVHGLSMNQFVARVLLSPKATRLIFGTGVANPKRTWLKSGTALGALLLDDIGGDTAEVTTSPESQSIE